MEVVYYLPELVPLAEMRQKHIESAQLTLPRHQFRSCIEFSQMGVEVVGVQQRRIAFAELLLKLKPDTTIVTLDAMLMRKHILRLSEMMPTLHANNITIDIILPKFRRIECGNLGVFYLLHEFMGEALLIKTQQPALIKELWDSRKGNVQRNKEGKLIFKSLSKEVAEKIAFMRRMGLGSRTVAKMLGVSAQTVIRYSKAAGIDMRHQPKRQTDPATNKNLRIGDLEAGSAFKAAVRRWVMDKPSPITRKRYVSTIRLLLQFLKDTYGKTPIDVDCITHEDCCNYRDHALANFSNSTTTASTYMSALKAFFGYCHKHGISQIDAMFGVQFPKQDQGSVLTSPLCKESIVAVIEQAEFEINEARVKKRAAQVEKKARRNYAILYLMLTTGIRLSSCATLRKRDFTFAAGNHSRLSFTQKGQRRVNVNIPAHTAQVMQEWINAYIADENPDAFIFQAQHGKNAKTKNHINAHEISNLLRCLGKRAKIPELLSPRTLRVTYASMAALNGMDIFELSQRMGHRSPSQTAAYARSAMRIEGAKAIPDLRNGASAIQPEG